MHYYGGTAYSHCRSGSDSGLHRRNFRGDTEPFDSGDSTLSELDESESASGSGNDIDPNLPYPGIAPIALRYLSQTTRPRNWCLALISNPWFERISMMVILLNCVTLGMYQPCMDDKCETNRCKILELFDDFIFAFFALEMTIKMIAMGVYGRGSYLADSWNRLDLFIVLAGAIEYGLHIENLNLTPVRTIRVLRPLRAINRIPSMRILVMLLLDTLPMLGNVLLLCFFVFFIFGIVGVQLWQGILRQRCYLTTELYNLTITYNFALPRDISHFYKLDHDQEYICTRTDGSGMHSCSGFPTFKNGSEICNLTIEQKYSDARFIHNDSACVNWNLYYTNCSDSGPNPFQGTISFDNIGLAWVSIFLVISLEGWTDIMYFVQDAHSFWDWIYFVLLIVIGSFFMINLCLVVIATQFSETKKREMERMRLERARFQSSSTLASSTNNSEPTSCYAEIVKYIAHLYRRNKRRFLKKIRLYRVRQEQRRDRKMIAGETIRLNYAKRHHPNCPRLRTNQPASVPSTRAVSRASSIGTSDNNSQRDDLLELPASSSKKPSVLRVPSVTNQEIATNNNDVSDYLKNSQDETVFQSPTNNLLSPPNLQINNHRRRSSVMFSDVVVLHDNTSPPSSSSNLLLSSSNIDKKNVCSSEKTTQAGDGNIWQISSFPNQQEILQTQQQIAQDCYELMNGEAMTCQELLALGAINAAGQIVADTFLSSLTKGISSRNNREDGNLYVQQLPEDEFACCHDLWHCEAEYKNEKRSRLYVVSCLILKGFIRALKMCRKRIQLLVEHRHFQRAILLAILINTLSMGIEYHNQPDMLTTAVEISNGIFSAIFAVEMLLKVIAEGPFGYISNGFNVFDGIIVILSGIELFQTSLGQGHHDSALSVLRTFRLLRILKLVRFMPNLRRQLFVMLRTMDNVAIFFSLLILFIFIFSILGMYLFGGKFCNYKADDGTIKECSCEMIITHDERCECDRKHFNNILWATVTVFQILTQEDWNIVLSNGMAKTSHWAALYFVALMTFGNYVLFNLLVAILVEGFSSERNERREREQRELARRKMSCMLEASLRSSSEETSRSVSSSSGSYHHHDAKNCWRSADDLRKTKESNNCHCSRDKDCCYLDVQAGIEPKCNIQKESLSRQSPRQTSPPIITHTAATPQDSPSTTLDDFPEFRYNVTIAVTNDHQSASDSSPGGVSSTESTHKTSSLSLLKPPSLSPPPVNFRQFERPLIDESSSPQTARIVTHNEKIGSKTMTFSEKVTPKLIAPQDPGKNPENKAKMQRKCSWKLTNPQSSKRKNKNRSGSDSDAVPLNNGRDHSQCNGGGISRQASLRNDSLLQSTIRIQNDTQSDAPNNRSAKGFSPQNSIRCRSNTYSSTPQASAPPALTRHNSLVTSSASSQKLNKCASPALGARKINAEPKSVNSLNDKTAIPQERTLPRVRMEDLTNSNNSGRSSPGISRVKKLLMLFEPTGFMKEKDEYSLYLFSPNNKFRQWCTWFVTQKWFDNAVLLFIALNCITLAMERPNIPQKSTERFCLFVCNYIFTVVFTIEMFVKVVSTGMCYGPNAYFTSGWNIMDGFLVIISIVDLLMTLIGESSPRIFGILRVFRLLRSLRPLRVINRAPGLKLVVQTLLSSLKPIGNIVLICCTFFIIFGILGVQLFKGAFGYCEGRNLTGIVSRKNCTDIGYHWKNQKYNFDDLGQALMSLFVLSSRDGWVNIMYHGLDAVGEDLQPITNYNEWRLLYFIAFILLVGFFVLNMFVGVVVENFHRCREEQEKEERVRRAAKRALQLEKRRKRMNQPPYYINYGSWRLFIHNVVTSKYFDLAIAAVIGLNVVTMATESYRMAEILSYILRIFNYFFTAVFILESTMKLIALGVMLYIKDKWNLLDIAIVILSVVGIVLEELKTKIIPINPTVLRVMRVMRIARVLKLLKMAKGIRALLDTVMQALPQVGNLGLLFFLLFFIFAALGVELFGRLDCDKILCQGLGEHAHFQNFGMAFLTLFRVATGDNWNGIMKDTLAEELCDKKENCVTNCCVSNIIAPVFFVIFVLMAQFVLVNVVVAVLMKHLEESHKHLEDEQDMDNQLEREFAEKQEMEERRELCLALQMDQECQRQHKPLTKVLSLPSNFTYNPPGSITKAALERLPSFTQSRRRQTLHSHQPIMSLNIDDIKSIDESISDIYSIQECGDVTVEKNHRQQQQIQTNLDEIISLGAASQCESLLKVPKSDDRYQLKRINETNENNRLLLAVPPAETTSHKPLTISKLYGSTRHLFSKQKSLEITEETPFLLASPNISKTGNNQEKIAETCIKDLKIPKHDSQESVQRIIKERRKLDDYDEFNEYDIFDVTHNGSEEHLVDDHDVIDEQRDKTTDSENENQC